MDLTTQTVLFAVSRFFHISAAVIAVGGTFMLRYAVLPAIEDQERLNVQADLHSSIRRRLQVIIPVAIGLLLLSGLVNLMRAFMVAPPPPVAYHMILGVKLLLAFGMFGVAMGLVWPSTPPNAIQRKRRMWLSFNVHAGLLLIACSVAMRFLSGK